MPGLKICNINAFDIPDAWFQCLTTVLEHGRERFIARGSYETQRRKEFDYVVVQITNPGNRPLAPIVPEGFPPPANDEATLKYFLEYLATDLKKPNEDYTYGQRLVNPVASLLAPENLNLESKLLMKNINQIEEIIDIYANTYKNKGSFNNNQAIMAIGSPFDLQLKDPPCLRQIDTRIEEYGKGDYALHFFVYFRSWDLIGGFPTNLGGIQLLKEYMVSAINKKIGVEVKDGEIIADSKGLHIYDHQWDYAKIRCGKKTD